MYDPARDSWKEEDDTTVQAQTSSTEAVETKSEAEESKTQESKSIERTESTSTLAQSEKDSTPELKVSEPKFDSAESQQHRETEREQKTTATVPEKHEQSKQDISDNLETRQQDQHSEAKNSEHDQSNDLNPKTEVASSQKLVNSPKKESNLSSSDKSDSTLTEKSKILRAEPAETNGKRQGGSPQNDSAVQAPPRKIRKPNSRMSQQERDNRSREQRERLERRERDDRRYDDHRNDNRRYDDRRYDDRRDNHHYDDRRYDDRRNDHYRRYDDRRDNRDRHYDDSRYDDRKGNEGSNNNFGYGPADNDRSIVRNHYNQRPDQGIYRRHESPIIKLRTFNNWVKAVLINKFTRRGNVVLDIGCGKGGDLLKWGKEGCAGFIGIDIADVSISQAKQRYEQVRDKTFWADFRVGDAFEQNVEEIVQPEAFPVDIVSSQFCLHYAFESEDRVRMVLSNITRALKPGGTFIGTIPNSDVINKHIRKLGPTDLKWGNSIYSVEFENPPPRDGIFNPIYGHKYRFFLEDAVGNIPEYVVPFDAFKKLVEEEFGFELVYKKSFLRMFDEEVENRNRYFLRKAENMGMYKNDGTLGIEGDEREACGFYLAFAFVKR